MQCRHSRHNPAVDTVATIRMHVLGPCLHVRMRLWHLQMLARMHPLTSHMASPVQAAAKVDKMAAGGL